MEVGWAELARAVELAPVSGLRLSLVELDRFCAEGAGLWRWFRRLPVGVPSCIEFRWPRGTYDRLGHEGDRLLGLGWLSARGRPRLSGRPRQGGCGLWLRTGRRGWLSFVWHQILTC